MTNIEQMFDEISERYDFLNSIISFGLHKLVKKTAIQKLDIKDGDKILDLCTGTGDIAGTVKEKYPNCQVFGLDFSSKMLEIASKKHSNIIYTKGDASKMPYNSNDFDFVISSFGFRNVEKKEEALLEVKRVLKNGGKFLHLDFGKSLFSSIYNPYVLAVAKIFSKHFYAYKYLINSKEKFLSPDEFCEMCKKTDFKPLIVKNLLFNIISYQIVEKN